MIIPVGTAIMIFLDLIGGINDLMLVLTILEISKLMLTKYKNYLIAMHLCNSNSNKGEPLEI